MERIFYCPQCKNALEKTTNSYYCRNCGHSYPIGDDFISLVGKDATHDVQISDAAVFDYQFSVEQKHFWHNGRREIILDILKRHIPGLTECRMLEIGCGTGYVLSYLQQNGIGIEGADISTDALKHCRQRAGGIGLYQVDIHSLPFRDDFDIIGLFDVLEHIDEDESALANINQALKPGGKALITVPAHRFLQSYKEIGKHKRRYSKKELVDKLERNGFIVNSISYYMFFLLPLIFLIRTINNIRHSRSATPPGIRGTEHMIIPFVNGAFLRLLRLEKRLMRYLTLPFGASLVVLAEKKSDN